jgi:S1-C subfamily serine protease
VATIVNIQYFTGSLTGRSQRLVLQEGQRVRMGRAQDTDIRFSDAVDDSVSSMHAEIFLQQNRVYIEDKRSTNGTFVNGQRCAPFQPIAVADGARIRLGKEGPEMQLLVESSPAQAADPAARGTTRVASTPSAAAASGAVPPAATAAGPGAAAPKQAIGRTTLLSEIDSARQDERKVVMGQIASSRRSTGMWVGLGLLFVLLVAALGIGGAMYWNRRQLANQSADTDAAVAKVRQDAAQMATTNVWAGVEQHDAPAVVHIRCKYRLFILKTSSLLGGELKSSDGAIFTDYDVEGSGVLIKPGLVLTAKHVAAPWKYIENWASLEKEGLRSEYQLLEVQFPNQQPIRANLVAASDKFDLALLQIQATNAPSVPIVSSNDDIKVTDHIAVIGYPESVGEKPRVVREVNGSGSQTSEVTDISPTIVLGSVTHGFDGSNDPYAFIFNAAITSGDDGGAVLNERGELIGVVGWQSLREVKSKFNGLVLTYLEPMQEANPAMSPKAIQEFLRTYGMG